MQSKSHKPRKSKKTAPRTQLESYLETLAGLGYVGLAGISAESRDAVLRLIQFGNRITRARILSNSHDHCFLLTVDDTDEVAVKSGFGSGYRGEGARAFSYVLKVLRAYEAEIDEYRVSEAVLQRLDASALTTHDLKRIRAARPVRPRRWHEYILDDFSTNKYDGLWDEFPAVIPLAIVDTRIADLAISFRERPDDSLMTGYRRLEDVLRKRIGIDEHGTKLISQAFNPSGGKLTWKTVGAAERGCRLNLFSGAFGAYRNRRAHREAKDRSEEVLTEFLLLNHLFLLEQESTETDDTPA